MKHKIVNSKIFTFFVVIMFSLTIIATIFLLTTILFKSSGSPYVVFLKKQLCFSCVPMMILGGGALLFGLVFFKKADSDIIDNWMIIVWFAFCIAFSVYIITTISIHYADIKNEDYVVYTGEFEKDQTRDFVFLNDKDTTRLTTRNETFLQSGRFSGTILYSKRSKYILSYLLTTGESASVDGGTR